MKSIEDMASKTMIYIISFSELYDNERRAEYEFVIQPKFTNLTTRVVDLRYGLKNKTLAGEKLQCDVWALERELDDFNIDLYQFASCFDKRARREGGCRSGVIGQPSHAQETCPFKPSSP